MQANYTVVAMYQDAEVGFGEGDSHEYAMRECLGSIPTIYPEEDVILQASSAAMPHLNVHMPMDMAKTVFE